MTFVHLQASRILKGDRVFLLNQVWTVESVVVRDDPDRPAVSLCIGTEQGSKDTVEFFGCDLLLVCCLGQGKLHHRDFFIRARQVQAGDHIEVEKRRGTVVWVVIEADGRIGIKTDATVYMTWHNPDEYVYVQARALT
jgi:hypothetical protein